jgi:hypothetical protein
MSYNELKAVPKFKVSNEHGSIEFLAKGKNGLDLTEVDLASIITISQKCVYVYEPEKDKPFTAKPEVGQKLNVPAIIYLKSMPRRKGESPQQTEDRLRATL